MFRCCRHAILSSKRMVLALPYCPVHGPVHGFVANMHTSSKFWPKPWLGDAEAGCFRSFHTACSTFFSCAALFFDMLRSCMYSVGTLLNMKWQRRVNPSCEMYGVSEKNSLRRCFMAQFWTPRWRRTTTVPQSDVTVRSSSTRIYTL